jgi:hypothetical protein
MLSAADDDSGFGVVHAGQAAINDLPGLVRGIGEGRALVLLDLAAGQIVRTLVEDVFAAARMQAIFVEVANGLGPAQRTEVTRRLSMLSGTALISVGSSAVLRGAKTIATMATNGSSITARRAASLRFAPRSHIAVPVGLGPAEEATSLVALDDEGHRMIDDVRAAAFSVIDHRLFSDEDGGIEPYRHQAVILSACVASDASTSLRDQTLALAAAHLLTKPMLGAAGLRHALTLATAAHRKWPLCTRCHAGTWIDVAVVDEDVSTSPAHQCLRQAVARGLKLVQAP